MQAVMLQAWQAAQHVAVDPDHKLLVQEQVENLRAYGQGEGREPWLPPLSTAPGSPERRPAARWWAGAGPRQLPQQASA